MATYDLQTYIEPGGYNASIQLSPMGTYVSPGRVRYEEGTVVTCTAYDYEGGGLNFTHWSGDFTGFEQVNPTKVYMTGNRTLTAHFYVGGETYQLTTAVTGQGSIFPASGSYPEGDIITLTATPQIDWEFTSWGGDIDGCTQSGNTIQVPMTKNRYITATFSGSAIKSYLLQTYVEPYGYGIISRSPAGTPMGNEVYQYEEGTNVTITAIPEPGVGIFDHWEINGISYYGNPLTVTMNGDKVAKAIFEPSAVTEYYLQIFLNPGTVPRTQILRGPEGVEISEGMYKYPAGTQVSLMAVEDDDWEFTEWLGDASGTGNPTTVHMDGNKMVTGVFTEVGAPTEGWELVAQQSFLLQRPGIAGGWIEVASTALLVGRAITAGWILADTRILNLGMAATGWLLVANVNLMISRDGEEPPNGDGEEINWGMWLAIGGAAALALMLLSPSGKAKASPVK